MIVAASLICASSMVRGGANLYRRHRASPEGRPQGWGENVGSDRWVVAGAAFLKVTMGNKHPIYGTPTRSRAACVVCTYRMMWSWVGLASRPLSLRRMHTSQAFCPRTQRNNTRGSRHPKDTFGTTQPQSTHHPTAPCTAARAGAGKSTHNDAILRRDDSGVQQTLAAHQLDTVGVNRLSDCNWQ